MASGSALLLRRLLEEVGDVLVETAELGRRLPEARVRSLKRRRQVGSEMGDVLAVSREDGANEVENLGVATVGEVNDLRERKELVGTSARAN